MKYVVIFAIIVLVIRLDFWVELFEKGLERLSSKTTEVSSEEVRSGRELISFADDASLKTTPKSTFLALLDNFRTFPDPAVRKRAMDILRSNPKLFGVKLDKNLEALVYRWRDLLILNEPEVVNFLLDLQSELKGENLAMVNRFFSLWMEINMENFIAAYSRTKDSNCAIATTIGDQLPEEEKLNEYYARVDSLNSLLQSSKLTASQRALANNCLLVLKVFISRNAPEGAP